MISSLAETMRIDRTTLNRNIKPLISSGLITVRPSEDPRSGQVMLTETGKAGQVDAWALLGEAQIAVQEYMGETELVNLEKLLSKPEGLVP